MNKPRQTVAQALTEFRRDYTMMMASAARVFEMAQLAAGDVQGTPEDIRAIQEATCDFFKISMAQIAGASRPVFITIPRQVAMTLCRSLTHHTTAVIGKAFDRDHSTVIEAARSVQARCETDHRFKERYSVLEVLVTTQLKAMREPLLAEGSKS